MTGGNYKALQVILHGLCSIWVLFNPSHYSLDAEPYSYINQKRDCYKECLLVRWLRRAAHFHTSISSFPYFHFFISILPFLHFHTSISSFPYFHFFISILPFLHFHTVTSISSFPCCAIFNSFSYSPSKLLSTPPPPGIICRVSKIIWTPVN